MYEEEFGPQWTNQLIDPFMEMSTICMVDKHREHPMDHPLKPCSKTISHMESPVDLINYNNNSANYQQPLDPDDTADQCKPYGVNKSNPDIQCLDCFMDIMHINSVYKNNSAVCYSVYCRNCNAKFYIDDVYDDSSLPYESSYKPCKNCNRRGYYKGAANDLCYQCKITNEASLSAINRHVEDKSITNINMRTEIVTKLLLALNDLSLNDCVISIDTNVKTINIQVKL